MASEGERHEARQNLASRDEDKEAFRSNFLLAVVGANMDHTAGRPSGSSSYVYGRPGGGMAPEGINPGPSSDRRGSG